VSPRKLSTSSGKPKSLRPRYLGVEVAGEPSVPSPWWEGVLADRLKLAAPADLPTRVRWIRRDGGRAIVEIDHRVLAAARAAWNIALVTPKGGPVQLRTSRTWGTLRGAKAWLRGAGGRPR
jgi:RNase P/RNase MRP subunit POP5